MQTQHQLWFLSRPALARIRKQARNLRRRSFKIATDTIADAPIPEDCYQDHIDRLGCKPLAAKNLLHCTLAAHSNPL
ncbi:hypothetical protein [Rhizobium sp. AN80A]|uniref:hypothetical protein n=1 Tax=Rhizobium sp. AN80A TaxID=3040673 RepID=UPI0024B3A0E8|nr:hypothetical protein [Rhizobium sp. AN80A]